MADEGKDMIDKSIYFAALYGLTYAKVEEGRYKNCEATLCDLRNGEGNKICRAVKQEDIDQETINSNWGELTMGWGNNVLTSRDIRAELGDYKYEQYYGYYTKHDVNKEVMSVYKWEITDIGQCFQEADKVDTWMWETLFRKWMSDRIKGTIF